MQAHGQDPHHRRDGSRPARRGNGEQQQQQQLGQAGCALLAECRQRSSGVFDGDLGSRSIGACTSQAQPLNQVLSAWTHVPRLPRSAAVPSCPVRRPLCVRAWA